MECGETKKLLDAYVDRELDATVTATVREHLAGCNDCGADERTRLPMRATARELRLAPPPEFVERVRSSIRADARQRHDRSLLMWRITAIAACLVAIASLAFAFARNGAGAQRATLADEAVASHVRSLLADHLLDV